MQATFSSKVMEAIRPALLADASFMFRREAPKVLLNWLSVGLACFVAACASVALLAPGQADVIWLANGVLLAVLMLSPRRWWAAYLAAGFLANVLAHSVFHVPASRSLIFSTANTVEVLVAALLLRTRDSVRPSLMHGRTLRRFLIYAVMVAPLCSTAVVLIFRLLGGGHPSLSELSNWYVGDALGIAILTPTILAMDRVELASLFRSAKLAETIGLLAG